MAIAAVAYFFSSEIVQFFSKGEKCVSEKLAGDDAMSLVAQTWIIGGGGEKVEGNSIFVNFVREGANKIYRVKIGPDTKIVKLDLSDPNNVSAHGKEMPTLPEIALSEIKKDDFVIVQAGEDIKDKTEFFAKVITLQAPSAAAASETEE